MATVPVDFPLGQFTVRLRCGKGAGATTSNALAVNVPRAWWFAGNCGNTSTPGGYLRMYGTGLSIPIPPSASAPMLTVTARDRA